MWRVLLGGIVLVIFSACAPVEPITPTPEATEACPITSAWGDVITLARAGLANPPALAISADTITLAYVTSDQNGARQVIRRLNTGVLSDPTTLTLPPIQPRGQSLFPASNGSVYLLWIDLDEFTRQPRLFSALITPSNEIARGPIPVSRDNERVYDYSAALAADGSLWVAWSGTISNEPAVSMTQIDVEGRPITTNTIASDALHPALIAREDGSFLLFYEQARADAVIRTLVAGGVTLESARITSKVSRTPATLVHSVYAASDDTHGYLWWNLTRNDGRRETWMTTGALDAANWEPPILFEPPYTWVRPLIGVRGDVRVGVTHEDTLGIVTLRGGQTARISSRSESSRR